MTKPAKLPSWATDGVRVDPGTSKSAAGWQPGEKLPAQVQNWLQGMSGDWLEYLEDTTDTLNTNVTALLNAAELRRHHDRISGFTTTARINATNASDFTGANSSGPRYLIGSSFGQPSGNFELFGAGQVTGISSYLPVYKSGTAWIHMGTGGASSTYPPTAVLRSGGNYYVTRADAKLYKGSLISAVYDATPINISTLTVVESLISASGILLAGGEADGSAAVARSTDLGDTWSHATLDSGSVTTLYTLSNGRILASADEDDETRIYSSDDAGVNWTLRDTVATSDAYQIFFGECPVSPGNVYYVSRKGVAKYSSNYGESFTSAGGALSAAGAMRVSAVWGAQPIANGLCVLAANWDGKVGLIRMSHPGQTISDISFNWMQIDHTLDFPSAGFFRAANTIQPYSPIGPSSAEKAIYGFRACVGPNPREIETPAV